MRTKMRGRTMPAAVPEVYGLPSPPFTVDTPVTSIHPVDLAGTIVIDNGSYECRVGGTNHEKPPVVFVNESRRPRKNEEIPHGSNIGWNITEEAWRFPTRNAFDHGILSNMDCEEDTLDFVFFSLGLTGQSRVPTPIAFSESLCNPNYCRNLASELLFECYDTPAVGYFVDSLASFYYNTANREEISERTSLIISSGHSSTTVIPIVDGAVQFASCKRVDVGGMHMGSFTQSLLKLKYPEHRGSVNAWVADYVQRKHIYYASDFQQELCGFYPDIYTCSSRDLVRTIQLPVPTKEIPKPEMSEEDKVRKKQEKVLQGQRLKAIAERRRQEKLEEQKEQLNSMQELLDRNLGAEELELEAKELGYDNTKDLLSEHDRIGKILDKASRPKESAAEKEAPLTEDDIRRRNNFDQWVEDNKTRQEELKQAIEQRELARTSWSSRRSSESQNRLRLLNEAADTRSEDAHFDDWEVYVTMQSDRMKDDDERDKRELQELIEKLEKYAPDQVNPDVPIEEFYQLKLGQERIRIPEVLYQPCMVGEDQMGLSESIQQVLSAFLPEVQTALVNNIFVTGGCSSIPQFKERIQVDLQRMRPTGATCVVRSALDPVLDSWRGARLWCSDKSVHSQFITKADYEENGVGYLKPHKLSNCFFPSLQSS